MLLTRLRDRMIGSGITSVEVMMHLATQDTSLESENMLTSLRMLH